MNFPPHLLDSNPLQRDYNMILKGVLISEGISNFHFDPIQGVPRYDIMSKNTLNRDLPNGGQNLPPKAGTRLLPVSKKSIPRHYCITTMLGILFLGTDFIYQKLWRRVSLSRVLHQPWDYGHLVPECTYDSHNGNGVPAMFIS